MRNILPSVTVQLFFLQQLEAKKYFPVTSDDLFNFLKYTFVLNIERDEKTSNLEK